MTKEGYADSLKQLEKISEEIHQRRAARQERCRKNVLGVRGQGVGAESTPKKEANGSYLFNFIFDAQKEALLFLLFFWAWKNE